MKHLAGQFERTAAFTYIRDQLAAGKTLSRLLLQNVQSGTGDLASIGSSFSDGTMQFKSGQKVEESGSHAIAIGPISGSAFPKPTSHDELARFIQMRLNSREHCSLLENSLADAADPWLQRAKSRIFVRGNEVYHVLLHSDRHRQDIVDAILEAENGTHFVGVIGRISNRVPFSGRSGHLSVAQLETVVDSCECIFVSAYDGEGYLIWEKREFQS